MGEFFYDTSAVVKRYVKESGSEYVNELANPDSGNVILLAGITRVEVVAAITRKAKGGTTTVIEAESAFAAFQYDLINIYYSVHVSPEVLDLAMTLARKYGLRGYDAVQLAAALDANTELLATDSPAITMVSADDELNRAAVAEGLTVENPNDYP